MAVPVAAVGPLRVGIGGEQRVDEALHQFAQQVRAGLCQVFVQELGGVDTGTSGHAVPLFEWVVGDSSKNHAVTAPMSTTGPITSPYTTLLDATRKAPGQVIVGA